jgi:hypothetical protein
LNPGEFIRRGSQTGEIHIHMCMLYLSHVMPCTVLRFCQPEGYHQMQPSTCTSRGLSQSRPPLFIIHSIYGVLLLARENVLIHLFYCSKLKLEVDVEGIGQKLCKLLPIYFKKYFQQRVPISNHLQPKLFLGVLVSPYLYLIFLLFSQ